jgi:hypothetical protein
MKTYQHTQSGRQIVMLMVGLAVVGAVVASRFHPAFFVTVPIMLLTAWLFSSLNIAIADGELRWHFGPGLIRKKIALSEIASAKVIQTTFIDGWGIHFTRHGWLYNIAGCGAVAITLKNGKRFALGSDEPEKLAEQILSTLKS